MVVKEIKDNQRALRCDSYEFWFHLSCTDIEECVYKAIGESESKGVIWFCQGCEGDVSIALKSYNEVKKRQDAIESKLEEISNIMLRSAKTQKKYLIE